MSKPFNFCKMDGYFRVETFYVERSINQRLQCNTGTVILGNANNHGKKMSVGNLVQSYFGSLSELFFLNDFKLRMVLKSYFVHVLHKLVYFQLFLVTSGVSRSNGFVWFQLRYVTLTPSAHTFEANWKRR